MDKIVILKPDLDPDKLIYYQDLYYITEGKIYELIQTAKIYDPHTYKEIPPSYILYSDDNKARLINNDNYREIFIDLQDYRNKKIESLGL